MAKQTKPAAKKEEGIRLNRLDAQGGFITVATMAEAERLLKVEEKSGVKNYELADGETEQGDDSGAVEGAQE